MNLDAVKQQKQALLNSKAINLKERSKQNPYLNDVVAQYDAFEKDNQKTQANLVDALQIIKAHIEFLKKKHGDDSDTMKQLDNDFIHVQNKLNKYAVL